MEELLDKICETVKIKKVTSLIKEIKRHPTFKSDKTVLCIANLAYWLYIIDEYKLSFEVSSLIDKIKFDNDYLIWEPVQSVLILQSRIYRDNGENEKSKIVLFPIKEVDLLGDEDTIEKNKRILNRVLNGSLLYDKFIQEDQQENDFQSEILHRFLQLKTLCYMSAMGGSEKYSIEYLENEIREEKAFLKKNVNIAK